MAEWEQWEAVQGPRSHCGLSSSVTRRCGGPWPIWGLAGTYRRPVICQQPYGKKWTTAGV
ncbi:unnamed protein product [Staurois parvus]|uniref:Uncharacterized protein n=1 Tax=Staurois parvus TaxID=386267 RepID=A0ABN9C8S1_9NEOB|nr:unnamed protein product [Staurois parvus]